ncbi:transcriptional repressor CTCF-like [Varroa jacobsoni]|uniref:C2H2-type domain-containing protein n=1 Tax=Varroa destructor TaxID=109461 RepID=A0A7M7JL42_VARDE|nr:transcriptional repressor CTCF-like [Varroa destructor]XP_022688192.1 transcriptional repressor CTCF-like [Varroa jacobsoni]
MSAVTGPVEGEAGQLIVADNSPEQQQQAAQAHAEGISDIQNYLASFNKEIADQPTVVRGGATLTTVTASGASQTTTTDATTPAYFVTQTADGQLQYTPAPTGGAYFTTAEGATYYSADASAAEAGPIVLVDGSQIQQVAGVGLNVGQVGVGTVSVAGASGADGTGQIALALQGQTAEAILKAATQGGQILTAQPAAGQQAGVQQYQTVTIVPQDAGAAGGEVSYVLIVSQDATNAGTATATLQPVGQVAVKKDPQQDISVYEFDDTVSHKQTGQQVVTRAQLDSDGKVRTVKVVQKKVVQTLTQAHMCTYCNYTSPKRYLLSRHMKSHSEDRPHKCSVCERGFKTLASLQNHVNTHTGTRPHQCKECDASFTTSGELVRHVRYKHTHEKPHRCTECDYASVELSKLKRHMRCHTGERPYQCPHCTYASPDTYKLQRHLRIHTGEKPYECDICHARFTQSNSLRAHKLIHTGQKPIFQCELCPATCGRKTDLRIHVQKLHTSDRPLKCKRCGKSFADRYTYRVHAKSHEGEKCFKCDLCSYASISQRHLESHMLIHSDQKPFQCDECDQAFRQKQLLKRHKNLYHNPNYVPPTPKEKTHECPECNKAFRHKGNLIRHLAVHDPDATAQEKEEAMRIGQPKLPGEKKDGEEDDYDELMDDPDEEFSDEDDDDDDDEDEVMDEVETNNVLGTNADGVVTVSGHQVAQQGGQGTAQVGQPQATTGQNQVVVLEVIQVPQNADGTGGGQIQQLRAVDARSTSGGRMLQTADGNTLIIQQNGDGTTTQLLPQGELLQLEEGADDLLGKASQEIKKMAATHDSDKQKDVEECFGFGNDADEDEAILSLPAGGAATRAELQQLQQQVPQGGQIIQDSGGQQYIIVQPSSQGM